MGDDNKLAEQLNKLKLLVQENSKVLEQYKKFNLENKGLITSAEIERIYNLESQVKTVNGRILEIEIKKGISTPNQTDNLSDKFSKAFEAYKKACEAGTLSNEEAKILLQTMKSELASLTNSFNLMSAEYKNNKSEVLKTELNSLPEKIKKYSADYQSLSRDCIKDAVVEKSAEKKDNFEKKEIYENINDQKCFAIFLSDSGAPQKVGNYWQLTRTIERKEVDCNKEYGFINIEGKVYKSDLSLDELMKSLPNFEEHLYANKGFSKEEFLTEVRQQSVTWQKYRDFENGLKLKGETKISFPVVWDLTPGTNTNGQEEGNISVFLEKRKSLIEKMYADVSVCDTLEAQKSYFLFLMEFEDKYTQTSDRLKGVYKEFYEKIALPERNRMQGIMDNAPQDPLVAQLENSNILQGCVFKIVIQVDAKGERIAGELQFLRKEEVVTASNKIYVEYERRHPDKDPQLLVHINTQQGNQIEDGFAKQLLQEAVNRMSATPPLLVPNKANLIGAVIFNGSNGISFPDASRIHIEQAMGVPAPDWYDVSDGTVQVTHRDSCGRAIGFTILRSVTKIVNPDPTNCTYSAINYNKILPATMDDEARIGGTNVFLLPASALESGNFILTAIQQYFQKNPNAGSYTVPLSWNTPLPFPLTYTVTDGPLQPIMDAVHGMQRIIGWTAVRTITAVVDLNCNSQINWNNIWSQSLNLTTAQPNNLGTGVGVTLPATAQNSSTLAQLNTFFGGTAGVQTINLNWNFRPTPLGPVTFANNDSQIIAGAPTVAIIQEWVLFSIANPTAIFDFFGDVGPDPNAPAGAIQRAWDYLEPIGGTNFTNTGGTNLGTFTIGNRPTGTLLGNNRNVGTLMLWRAGSIANIFIASGIPNARIVLNAGNAGGGMIVNIRTR